MAWYILRLLVKRLGSLERVPACAEARKEQTPVQLVHALKELVSKRPTVNILEKAASSFSLSSSGVSSIVSDESRQNHYVYILPSQVAYLRFAQALKIHSRSGQVPSMLGEREEV
eukprot:g65750.t1